MCRDTYLLKELYRMNPAPVKLEVYERQRPRFMRNGVH